MRQTISQEQWDQLSEDERIYFADWFQGHYSPEEYPSTLATIGQIIQFIDEHGMLSSIERSTNQGFWKVFPHEGFSFIDSERDTTWNNEPVFGKPEDDLIDILWKVARGVLQSRVS